jgi:hypothetical protein
MLVILTMCLLACSNGVSRSTTLTWLPSQDTTAIPRPQTVEGCAAFDVRVQQNASVIVTPVRSAPCGPVQPVVVGSPFFDVSSGYLRLGVALRNSGRLRLRPPSSLELRGDSVLIASNLNPVRTSITIGRSAEGLSLGDTVDPLGQRVHLSYDAYLGRGVGETPQLFLASGDTSRARVIFVRMPPGVAGMTVRIIVQTRASHVFTVPVEAPLRSPDSVLIAARRPDNILVRDPHFGFRVSRAWLWLTFTKGATEEDRQAAVDAVNGIVVGGVHLGHGMYYVHVPVPVDSGGGPLARAMATLREQPGVANVFADYVDGPVAESQR